MTLIEEIAHGENVGLHVPNLRNINSAEHFELKDKIMKVIRAVRWSFVVFMVVYADSWVVAGDPASIENSFSDLSSVGKIVKSSRSIISENVYQDLANCEWIEKCATDGNKTGEVNVKFKYPSKMNCRSGVQPHIAYKVTKTFYDPTLVVSVNFGVWQYDEDLLAKLRNINRFDVRSDDFMSLANSMTKGAGKIIGAGMAIIDNRRIMWVTFEREKGRSGVKSRTVTRNFLIPITDGRLFMVSIGLTTSNTNGWPYRDFELFNSTGMRIIHSITFMDDSQVEAPRVTVSCKKQ